MQKSIEASECSLCRTTLPKNPYCSSEGAFCCAGCRTVHEVLLARGVLDGYEKHPLFEQAVQSGLISNPFLLEALRKKKDKPDQERHKLYFEVDQMWCPSCAEVIRLVLLQEKGVVSCTVDYTTDLASVEYAPCEIGQEQIFERIRSLGYEPHLFESSEERKKGQGLSLRLVLSAFCALNLMMFAYPVYASYLIPEIGGYPELLAKLSFFFSLPVLTFCAWPIFRRAGSALSVGIVGMECLVTMGVLAAFTLSSYELLRGGTHIYFDTMAVVITFVLLGKRMEMQAKGSTKQTLFRLARALPRRGRIRFPNGESRFVPMKEIQLEDTLLVLAGEKIVLEGVVLEGEAAVDESLLTGEAIPVPKKEGEEVLGGTVIQSGWLAIRVTATLETSILAKMIQGIEGELKQKKGAYRLVDSIVQAFAPAVLFAAVVVGIGTGAFLGMEQGVLRAISMLLIACPCAIGIAAPIAESRLLQTLAEMGIVVQNRNCLSKLGNESLFVFDKTGTITEGVFSITKGLESLGDSQRRALKSITSFSTHPVAVAIARSLEEKPLPLDSITEHNGRGIEARSQGNHYLLGSDLFLREQGIEVETLESAETTVYFAIDGLVVALITLGDRLKESAPFLVQSLHPVRTLLLSGDGEAVVSSVAKLCKFDEWQSRCHPLQKREVIVQRKEQGELVAMIGDGINDAAALTAADIGISVVSATDLSVQVSDLLLTHDRLNVLLPARQLAKKAQKILKQNLFWAFFYNSVGVCLAAAGYLSPIIAAAFMVLSSLMVIGNARRIRS